MPVRITNRPTHFVNEGGYRFVRGRLKNDLAGLIVSHPGGAGSKTTCARGEVAGKDPVLHADNKFSIPLEQPVVRTPLDVSHCVSVAEHKRLVLRGHIVRRVPSQDPQRVGDSHRNAFHTG